MASEANTVAKTITKRVKADAKTTLETSGEDAAVAENVLEEAMSPDKRQRDKAERKQNRQNTLGTSGEDVKLHSKRAGKM